MNVRERAEESESVCVCARVQMCYRELLNLSSEGGVQTDVLEERRPEAHTQPRLLPLAVFLRRQMRGGGGNRRSGNKRRWRGMVIITRHSTYYGISCSSLTHLLHLTERQRQRHRDEMKE